MTERRVQIEVGPQTIFFRSRRLGSFGRAHELDISYLSDHRVMFNGFYLGIKKGEVVLVPAMFTFPEQQIGLDPEVNVQDRDGPGVKIFETRRISSLLSPHIYCGHEPFPRPLRIRR